MQGTVMGAIAAELYRREGEKALDWAAGIKSAEDRKLILSTILPGVAGDSPEIAKRWSRPI